MRAEGLARERNVSLAFVLVGLHMLNYKNASQSSLQHDTCYGLRSCSRYTPHLGTG
jgi:hypothetical protein